MDAEVTQEHLGMQLTYMDDFLTRSFRQRILQLDTKWEKSDVSNMSVIEDVHGRAIKELWQSLTRDLRMEGTLLLDNLEQQGALSAAGRASILASSGNQKQNRSFLKFCNTFSSSKFKSAVIPAMKESKDSTNYQLACDMEDAMSRYETDGKNKSICSYCKMKDKVNLRRLADALMEYKSISVPTYEDLASSSLSHEDKWETIRKMRKPKSFSRALKKKYQELYFEIKWNPEALMLGCVCTTGTETATEEDMEVDKVSDIARMSDFSGDTDSTPKPKVNIDSGSFRKPRVK
ncbi:uncharacterized protein LOC125374402 [Haliotis rufescens]|uniref:uncharacterized protein LOC125374402 n=1 Tax=Haliotis rufescens TaxID=6454 RepID=UPI00201EF15B|nr:uncharacterized protein LOC125374402 [Haliotis rufescens]